MPLSDAPQFLTVAYWPTHNRVEKEFLAQGVDELDAVAEAFFAGLRAVEAAVRADQIERDAAIADSIKANHFPETMGWESGKRIATAIRAQLNGENDG